MVEKGMGRFWGLAGALLLAGTALRVWGSAHAQVNFDQMWFWGIALDIVHLKDFPAYGSLISGTDARVPSPLFHYICALPQLISDHPRVGAVFFCFLHTGVGLVLVNLAKKIRGERAALFWVALYAFAPWDVLYSHSIWLGNILPVYGTVLVACAFAARTKKGAQTLLVVLLFAGPAMHLSLPIAWVAALVVFRKPKLYPRALIAGALLGALFFVPTLIEELSRDFANTRAILNKAMGDPPRGGPLRSAAQVPIYSVLFSSSEMGYWFSRGYWGGGFDAIGAYTSFSGWKGRLGTMPPWRAAATAVSVSLAVLGWGFALGRTALEGSRALQKKGKLSEPAVLTLAVVTCLFVSAVLLFKGQKLFFPHYISVLMPLCLWPVVWFLDVASTRWRAWVLLGALLISMGSMLANTVRYYQRIESLNGLSATMEIVEWILEPKMPVELRFRHIPNDWGYRALAERRFGQKLRTEKGAPLKVTVYNDKARKEAPLAKEGEEVRAFGLAPIWVKRQLRLRAPEPGRIFNARAQWEKGQLTLQRPQGAPTGCKMSETQCDYGENSWQHYAPDFLRMGGRLEPVLFLHPAAHASLSVRYEVPSGATRGLLWFGLSDGATKSANKSPVVVRLWQGEQLVAKAQAENHILGLSKLPFSMTSTGARSLKIDITTENEGARVFGFDLDLFGD